MKRKPSPIPKAQTDEKKIEEFLQGAEHKPDTSKYPWQGVSNSTIKVINVKLPESYAKKLEYLVKNTVPKVSKHHFLLERVLLSIDEELKKRDLPTE